MDGGVSGGRAVLEASLRMILTLFELATWVVLMGLLFTQVVFPWMESRPYFPALRRRERRLARLRQLELERQQAAATLEELSKPFDNKQKETN